MDKVGSMEAIKFSMKYSQAISEEEFQMVHKDLALWVVDSQVWRNERS